MEWRGEEFWEGGEGKEPKVSDVWAVGLDLPKSDTWGTSVGPLTLGPL